MKGVLISCMKGDIQNKPTACTKMNSYTAELDGRVYGASTAQYFTTLAPELNAINGEWVCVIRYLLKIIFLIFNARRLSNLSKQVTIEYSDVYQLLGLLI